MKPLTPDEKKAVASEIANIFGTAVGKPETSVVDVVAKETAFAAKKFKNGSWSKRRAQKHVAFATKAAASIYASQRALKQRKVKAAVMNLVNTLGGIVNDRVGFKLLPIPS